MLRRRLPSTNSLFSFEVVARLNSFSDAARELNVTQPAVSRSINELESHLGYPLFNRHGRWIDLTPNGDKLYRATSLAFGTIIESMRDIEKQQESREVVVVSLSAAAANFWFIPRMDAFKEKFPDVSLSFQVFSKESDERQPNFDLAVRLSNLQDADMHRWPYSDEKILALCSPEYLAEFGSLDQPVAGTSHTLIELADQRYSMDEFFHTTGQQTPENPLILRFSEYSSIIQAAIQGQGVALAWVTETSKQVILGNLVPACTQVVKTGRRYHILASNLTPMRPVVENIRDWMINEMRNDQKQMLPIMKASWDLF